MVRNFIILFICTLILLGCSQESTRKLTDEERSIITNEVKSRVLEYVDAQKQRDQERMLDFWANDSEFVFAGDGSIISDYNIWANSIKEDIVEYKTVNYIDIENPHVYVLSLDAASYAMSYRWSKTNEAGDTLSAVGSWMFVFKKFEDTWRVIHSAGAHKYN